MIVIRPAVRSKFKWVEREIERESGRPSEGRSTFNRILSIHSISTQSHPHPEKGLRRGARIPGSSDHQSIGLRLFFVAHKNWLELFESCSEFVTILGLPAAAKKEDRCVVTPFFRNLCKFRVIPKVAGMEAVFVGMNIHQTHTHTDMPTRTNRAVKKCNADPDSRFTWKRDTGWEIVNPLVAHKHGNGFVCSGLELK